MSLHGIRKSSGGIGLGRGGIVRAVDRQHGEVPGRGNEKTEGPAEQRPALREIGLPLPGEGQVGHDTQQGNENAQRAFGQRAQRHADIKQPQETPVSPRIAKAEPEAVGGECGEKHQFRVGQDQAVDADKFHVQQENERAAKRKSRPQQAMQKEVVEHEQRETEKSRRQPGRHVIHAEQGIGAGDNPVRQRGFGVPRLIIQRGGNPVPGFEHFACGAGIAAFVAIGQAHVPKPEQEKQAPADKQEHQVKGARGKWGCVNRWGISHEPFAFGRSASGFAGRPTCRFPAR